MKFTGALSTLLLVLPFVVMEASAAPAPAPFNFGGITGRFGGQDKNGKNGKNGGTTSSTGTASASSAANSTTATGAAAGSAANSTASTSATSSTGAAAGGNDPQTSLTLDPSVIGANIASNGLGNGSEVGQVASATSKNNFINSCIGKTITNGLQIQAGSCNPIPMGDIPSKANQPSAKFISPPNLGNVGANTAFTVSMAVSNMETGNFVNPNTNYFGAPQALNSQGLIVGHSHFVIQSIPSITSTQTPDPNVFAFFQGLNGAAKNGVLSASVAKGLPDGTYRLFSINTAANHQPVIGPVAQHGSFDDAVYFTVGTAAAQAAAQAVAGAASNGTAAAPTATPPAANATASTPPQTVNATAAGANAGANNGKGASNGKGAGKGKNGRRSFMITRQN